jgi:hypothetical protein
MYCTILIVTIFAYTIDHAESKTEVQAEQVQWVFGGPQAPSVVDTNITFGSSQAPMHPTKVLIFYT